MPEITIPGDMEPDLDGHDFAEGEGTGLVALFLSNTMGNRLALPLWLKLFAEIIRQTQNICVNINIAILLSLACF